jgi:2',3'-cyclic-nucleotide 2'-phosphodiesterase (5'-nucleotidase family)
MVSELGELISRYEAAQSRLKEVVEAGSDSDAELLSADRELSAAFDDVMQLELGTHEDYIQRVRFVLEQIKSNQIGNKLVERMADQVLQDLVLNDSTISDGTEVPSTRIAGQN